MYGNAKTKVDKIKIKYNYQKDKPVKDYQDAGRSSTVATPKLASRMKTLRSLPRDFSIKEGYSRNFDEKEFKSLN